jgi:WD40 repeat protein
LAVTGNSGTTTIWGAATGKRLLSLAAKGHVSGAAFHPGGQLLATHEQSQNGALTITVWGLATSQPIRACKPAERLFGGTTASGVAFHPAGTQLAAIQGKHVGVWDWEKEQELFRLTGHDRNIACVDFSPDENWIATASLDGTIKIWSAENGRLLHTLTGHVGPVLRVRFSADSKRLVSTGPDQTVRFWHPRSGKLIHTFSERGARAAELSPNHRYLAAIGSQAAIRVWDAGSDEAAPAAPPPAESVKP